MKFPDFNRRVTIKLSDFALCSFCDFTFGLFVASAVFTQVDSSYHKMFFYAATGLITSGIIALAVRMRP